MSKTLSRRQALTAGAAATGLMFGASTKKAVAEELPDVWGQDFMTQWSAPETLKKDLKPGVTPIRISCEKYRLHNDNKVSFADQVKALKAAGFTAAEAGSRGWRKMADSEIRELQAVLKENDVLFYTLHTWVNIIHPDPVKRKECQKHVCEAIENADALGMKYILTHTGGNSPTDNKDMPHPENWTKKTWDASVAATKQILKDTAGSTVNLAFEAVNSCNNNTPQSHVRLRNDVGDPRVKVCLDPVNMLHTGTVFRTTELIDACFDLIGEDIAYAHAKDIVWNEMLPTFVGVELGKGVMDYETYLTRLSHMKHPMCLLIEHLPADLYEPSYRYLKETAARLGVKIYS